jgi:hypothetical protein
VSTAIVVSNLQLAETLDKTAFGMSEIRSLVDLDKQKNLVALEIAKHLRAFLTEAEQLSSQLRAIQVIDQDTCDFAGQVLRQRADFKDRVAEFFKPMKREAKNLHDTVSQSEKFVLGGLNGVDELAEQNARTNISKWIQDQERIQKQRDIDNAAAQRKLDDEARELAAKHAEVHGAGPEAVAQIREAELPLSPPKSSPTFHKPAGFSTGSNWTWRFETTEQAALKAIVKAAAKDPRLLGYLQLNTKAFNSDAKSKKSTADVPGIHFFDAGKTSVRK